jgi:uncharacterized Zn-binding protein involved in type VI secretion
MGYLAARLDDAHSCPRHGGATILPACAPTILIEGKPAARQGDEIVCYSGDKGTIDQGEPTVLMEGRPAAHLGSGTSHGGRILLACAHTYVGAVPGGDGSKADRVRIRQELIAAAYAYAATMPPGKDKNDFLAAIDGLKRNNVAVEHANLCENSYDPDAPDPEGWQRLEDDNFDSAVTGFYAQAYRSTIDGSIVVVFRGTDIWDQTRIAEAIVDFVAGNSQGLGTLSPQYFQAIVVAQLMQAKYGDKLTFAGDSLGGGLATVAALATGAPADTFNAAGIHRNTLLAYGLNPFATGNIDAYQVDGDLLSTLQQSSGLPFPLSLLPLPIPDLPDALGNRHTLPAYNGITPRGFPPRTGGLGGLKTWAWNVLVEMANRHLPRAMIDSLEAQKAAQITAIKGTMK